jgi:hypothetical protein
VSLEREIKKELWMSTQPDPPELEDFVKEQGIE